jgi:hypothetical protein
MTIGDICKIKTNFQDADFWLQRRGSIETVGKPTKEYYEENIGIKVRDQFRDKVDSNYLYYYFMFLHQKGVFQPISHGTLKLQNIRLGDIKSIPISFGENINEGIKASEAYGDIISIQTILDGKRDIGFIATSSDPRVDNTNTIKAYNLAKENSLNFIEVEKRKGGKAWVIFKNNSQKAKMLADFATSKNGYLRDETPEEARFIGNLLDYNPEDVENYVMRRYYKS